METRKWAVFNASTATKKVYSTAEIDTKEIAPVGIYTCLHNVFLNTVPPAHGYNFVKC